jgi:alanyl-tRNA synthetase
MRNSEIRHTFFEYFNKKKHYRVLSSPLVPAKDPSILFTNAGMNQFKDVFLGLEKREYNRAVSIQKCMRVSGKHNDFNEVGKTQYHHTFFEMLGNFSFGNYFKEEAIQFAWELLTQYYHFDPEKLWVSVFEKDDEAAVIWEKKIGVPESKIIRLDEKDNFWQMGETGPCGPCSEIHFDKGEAFGPANLEKNSSRFVEIWNLVFMQYNRDSQGNLNPLKSPSIDTGMGMERLASLLQGLDSNYQTDLFRPIIDFTGRLAEIDPAHPGHQIDFNVIADHVRALSFLISDGVLPANDGRGYVLRRLLRRASKHGKSLGFEKAFLFKISDAVVEIMKEFYPELEYNRKFISEVIFSEEEKFIRTLSNGLKKFEEILEKAAEKKPRILAGKELFKLSDTYGFPLDFAVDLAAERDISIDFAGYHDQLDMQRKKSRTDLKQKRKISKTFENIEGLRTEFIGYDRLDHEAKLLAIFAPENRQHVHKKLASAIKDREPEVELILVFDQTPFYPEAGGQIGDSGNGKNESTYFEITDTQKTGKGIIIHLCRLKKGKLDPGDRFMLSVDQKKRQNTAIHHSATHLLHYALREVLGLHVKQAGSYVGPDKLRFDFTHFKPVSQAEIKRIEEIVNAKVRENLETQPEEMGYENAIQEGAIALFQEKYSDRVRVISMGDVSKELCGGTHIHHSGEIGLFKIISESSISSGIRRIEAVAGENAFRHMQESITLLNKIQNYFNQSQDTLYHFLVQLDAKLKEKEKQLKAIEKADETSDFTKIAGQVVSLNHVKTVIEYMDDFKLPQLRTLADEIKNRNQGISVLASNINGKSAIVVSVFKKLAGKLDARTLIKDIAKLVDGSGGGRPDFAQAGGKPLTDITGFKKHVSDIIKKCLT